MHVRWRSLDAPQRKHFVGFVAARPIVDYYAIVKRARPAGCASGSPGSMGRSGMRPTGLCRRRGSAPELGRSGFLGVELAIEFQFGRGGRSFEFGFVFFDGSDRRTLLELSSSREQERASNAPLARRLNPRQNIAKERHTGKANALGTSIPRNGFRIYCGCESAPGSIGTQMVRAARNCSPAERGRQSSPEVAPQFRTARPLWRRIRTFALVVQATCSFSVSNDAKFPTFPTVASSRLSPLVCRMPFRP
jgi:hypothetical protein